MRILLAVFALATSLRAGEIKPVAPLQFPVQTRQQFLGGAQSIVDLGGDTMHKWTLDLARENPAARVDVVNIQPPKLPVAILQKDFGAANMNAHTYDFFQRPEGHPTGQRVVVNSPHFGGVQTEADASRFAEMLDAHMEPGGLAYIHADDMFFAQLWELSYFVRRDLAAMDFKGRIPATYQYVGDVMNARRKLVEDALIAKFGKGNVSSKRLSEYDRDQLNAAEKHTYQIRKP